jgi:mannose/cellobiose epimerase-like protein (N-acyl-D-glucosamine 2-epimerase family)
MVLALADQALGRPVDFEIMQRLLRQSLRAAGRSGAILDLGTALAAGGGRFEWWPQAELLLPRAILSLDRPDSPEADWPETWRWIDAFMIDREHGGWRTAVGMDLKPALLPKGGFWIEPYHQARAVIGVLAIAEGDSGAMPPL